MSFWKFECILNMFFPTPVNFLLSYFPALFPRVAMSLFSRISVFCSGWSTVFDTIALATSWIGTAMDLNPTADTVLKNFLAIHSAGRLSCLSTNKTLWRKSTKGKTERLYLVRSHWLMKCHFTFRRMNLQEFNYRKVTLCHVRCEFP